MQYYILPSPVTNAADRQYILMVVTPRDEASFLAAHGHQVIAQGGSIEMELPPRGAGYWSKAACISNRQGA